MIKPDYTPSERFEAIAYFLGWQGGTCHQIDKATGCKDSLARPLATKDSEEYQAAANWQEARESLSGFSAIRTCSRDWRRDTIAPKEQGNWIFWTSAIQGYWSTGALGGPDFSARFGNT